MTTDKRPEWDKTYRSFTFEYLNEGVSQNITLFVNPEEFTQSEPARVAVTQTKGGAFVDQFGEGIKTISIRGVTGYRPRDLGIGGASMSGQGQFLELRDMIRQWEKKSSDPGTGKNHVLRFYNWADEEHYEIIVNNFNLMRSVGRPLLYQYTIAITCIRKLGEPRTGVTEEDATFDKLLNPQERAPLIQNRLTIETSKLRDWMNGIGLGNVSASVSTWSYNMSRDMSYFNSTSSTYKTVESVISEVENLSKDIGLFSSGATTFIVRPFELVRDLSTSLSDVAFQLCSIANIPHEVIRSLREMQCAVRALPESLFKGFTNPELFEGESGCGSTLGIEEASVASYSNSFTATVQVPPERVISQIVRDVASTIILKEEPLKVIGVYVETDISRTGVNYLSSYSGNVVQLSSTPTSSIVIDYTVAQDTAKNMIKLTAAAAYIVKQGDTLPGVSVQNYGDASRWKEIALYNSLEYPYIVDDLDFETRIKATGVVRFYRASGVTAVITIPENTNVYVPAWMGTNRIDFITTESKVLDLAMPYIDVPIESELEGDIGNVAPGMITGFDTVVFSGISKISNLSSIIGGKIYNVAKIGDIIQIPSSDSSVTSVIIGAKKSYEELFGIDILINEYGEIESSIEKITDFSRAFGVKNLVQALRNRIVTRKSFYPYHSEYGTNLPIYIGKKGTINWFDLIKVDIKDGVLLDPRIEQVKSFLMEIDGDSVLMSFDAIPINSQSSLPVNIVV